MKYKHLPKFHLSHTKSNIHARFWPSKLFLQAVAGVVLLLVVAIGLNFGFSSHLQESRFLSLNKTSLTVSTYGKVGVSGPAGLKPAGKSFTPIKSSLASATDGLPSAPTLIPEKPSWVYSPLYTDPNNVAAQYLSANPNANGAKFIARLAKTPVAQWFGDWNANVKNDVNDYVSSAAAAGGIPVVVVYNIPNRDCGGYSVGGAKGLTAYTQWVQQVAAGIGSKPAVVILEPDALGALDCLPAAQQTERTRALSQAVSILKSNPKTSLYLDAGTAVWQPVPVMASRLTVANIATADGFSLNISYFATTPLSRTFGDQLSSQVGYKHYVIDSSRNGADRTVIGMQCNPSFAAYGESPSTSTGIALNDAVLWIKIPWESDGACNGSPGPGEPYWDYAIQMAQNAGW